MRPAATVPIDRYASLLEGFDIGTAPLLDTRFNRCKSDLKVLEYSMAGVPFVASKVAPYEAAVAAGAGGLLARNESDWRRQLARLLDSRDLREELAESGRAWASTRTIEGNIHRWVRAYGLE